jgi:hypothetical protein
VANGRQHDAAGVDTGEHQRVDAVGAQQRLQVGANGCNAFAVLMAWRTRDPVLDSGFFLRSVAFAFAVSACMISLDKSAVATVALYPAAADPDPLDEIYSQLPGASFAMSSDPFAIERARAVSTLCHELDIGAIDPFLNVADFPFRPDLIDMLAQFSTQIIDNADMAERGLCELVARSLHGHPRGMRLEHQRRPKMLVASTSHLTLRLLPQGYWNGECVTVSRRMKT